MSSSRQSKDIDVKIMKLDVFRLVSLVMYLHAYDMVANNFD